MSGWNESRDWFVAEDGREFAIFSEQIRGEPRFYEARRKDDGRPRLAGESRPWDGDRGWLALPFDGSERIRDLRRAVERYVRETSG